MKNIVFLIGLMMNFLSSQGQDAKEILQQTYNKCQSVRNGYYEMSKYMKYMSGKDTTRSSYFCHFKELRNDSLYSSTFHYKEFRENNYRGDVLYTGDELVLTYTRDRTATIMSKLRWASKIKAYRNNFTFYTPLVNRKDSYLQQDSDFINDRNIFKFIGIENLKGMICYHVQVNKIPKIDTTETTKTLREEYHYWIKREDSIPIQYTLAFDIVMNNDTMYQYEKFVLNHYELNNLKDEKIISLNSIPLYYTTKDFVPYKSPELLKKDSIAPDWELLSLTDEKISLKSLKGQLVLIDFFYKSCYPCMLALPVLESLNEKYKDKGLKIIGIDPYDKKESDIKTFLSKRGVTYPVLLDGMDVATNYHISGYPTMYLIDKTGKILFIQVGYGKEVGNTLDEIIRKNL